MSVKIKYKGNTIASASTEVTKTIKTAGKYCEADILVENTPDGGDAPVINPLSVTANGTYTAPSGVDGYSPVTVNVPQGITPTGNINITDLNPTDVTNYATAQVVDADLIASNIKKDVNILGVVGSFEGGGGGEISLDLPSDTGASNLGACYMLIDKSDKAETLAMEIQGGNQLQYKVEVGYIASGMFVAETEYINTSTIEIPAHNAYKVVKISVTNNNQQQVTVGFIEWTSADVISYRLNVPEGIINGYSTLRKPCFTPSTRKLILGSSLSANQTHNMFNYCNAEEIDFANTQINTNPTATFQYAIGVKRIKISGTLNGNLNQMFYYCKNLRTIDFSGISLGTNVKQIKQMFYYCEKITEIDLSFMAAQSASFTNIDGFNRYMASLTTINLDGWDVSHLTAVYDIFNGCSSLENISMVGTSWIASSFSLSSCTKLTVESLNAVIAALPTVTGKTLTLGTVNKNKLTEAEKQVATDKGWTIA